MKKISLSEIRAPHSVDDFRVNLLKYFNSSYSMSDKTIKALRKQGAYVGKKGSVIAHPLRTNRSGYMDVSEIDSIHDLAKKWYEENLHLFLSQMPGRPPVEDPPCDLYLEPLIIPLNTDGWLELNRLPETSLLGKTKFKSHNYYVYPAQLPIAKTMEWFLQWFNDENCIIYENEEGDDDSGEELFDLRRKYYPTDFDSMKWRPIFYDILLYPFYKRVFGRYFDNHNIDKVREEVKSMVESLPRRFG